MTPTLLFLAKVLVVLAGAVFTIGLLRDRLKPQENGKGCKGIDLMAVGALMFTWATVITLFLALPVVSSTANTIRKIDKILQTSKEYGNQLTDTVRKVDETLESIDKGKEKVIDFRDNLKNRFRSLEPVDNSSHNNSESSQ